MSSQPSTRSCPSAALWHPASFVKYDQITQMNSLTRFLPIIPKSERDYGSTQIRYITVIKVVSVLHVATTSKEGGRQIGRAHV